MAIDSRERYCVDSMWFTAGVALWILPILAYRFARSCIPSHAHLTAGIALGAVASPASLGTYGLYWISGSIGLIGFPLALLGILGLMLQLILGEPGFYLATILGLRSARAVVHGIEFVYIESINTIVWAIVFGSIGYALDSVERRRKIAPATL